MAVSSQVEGLNRVRYGGLDFDTHFDDLRARAQVQFASDFNDFALSSLAIMLLDLVSYGLDTLSFYLDRRASDAYLDTARTRKAVARLSRQVGYKMGAAVSSSVDLHLAVLTPVAFSVPVDKGFQLRGPDDLIFEVAEQLVFDPLSGPTNIRIVPCYEGETVTENFVSNGRPNQIFELRRVPVSKFVVQGTARVAVNGADWVESEFLSFDKTDQFEVGYNDEPPTVRFGDGIVGNIPALGAPIVVSYVASRGKAGQVAAGSILEPVTPLVVNFTTIPLSIVNLEPPEGGDDPESLAKVKALAGHVFKARDSAVTIPDYWALANRYADPLYGRVAAAQALSSRSAAQDIFLQTCIAQIQQLIDPVKDGVNELLLDSVSLTGTANFVGGSALVTGTGTKFLSEVQVGQYIKKAFDNESLYSRVTAIASDTSLTLTAVYAGTTGSSSAVVISVPQGLRGVFTRLGLMLEDLQTTFNAVTEATFTINTDMTALLTTARSLKNTAVEMQNDATDIVNATTTALSEVALVATATANLAFGVGNSRVLYVAKVAGALGTAVRVAHTAAGSLSVAVVNNDITVSVAPASTATQVAAAIQASGPASALVEAYALGGGAGSVITQGLTNLGYLTPNALPLSGLPEATKAVVQQRLDRSKTEAASIQSSASSLQAQMESGVITRALSAQTQVTNIGAQPVVSATSRMGWAEEVRAELAVTIGSASIPSGLFITADALDAEVAPLDSLLVVGGVTVGTQLDNIYKHVDALLADDCKANLVTVPILTNNAAGFYTEPTIGLMQSLQEYLTARKEVTQTVKVSSGGRSLVRPVLLVRVGVLVGYSLSVTKTAVETAIDSLLRGRPYSRSLYLSDFNVIKDELVPGVSFLNVEILGYNDTDGALRTDLLDPNGNLIVARGYVITKEQRPGLASVTVTTEVAPTTNA